ncbi:hypothetical protein QFZ42_003321 [Variovorax paradoxus]|uniref:portal protein n=1 Tax=Variovorax paradoxus TaxID=34073 RepID=UPI00278E68F0|nr:portal protein [Variovorax paradoxus]MDQ0571487.1 hypothetical protein [Variovorax paradoxus]
MATKDADKKDTVLATAKERFEYALSRESENLERMKEDIRFAASSPDDPWQWDEATRKERKNNRPMLTINKLPQHIRQVTNDIRQNRPSIKYRPADDKADVETAEILMGLARHIEAHSDADVAYDTAADHQVTSGLGYIRVIADYISDESFDQDIYIKRVKNPFRVHMDPDIIDPAGSDAKWCFIDEDLKEDEFKAQYPDADPIDWQYASDAEWYPGDKQVRVVEYFEIVEKKTTLCLWANGETSFKDEERPESVMAVEKPLKERSVMKCECRWRKLNGQQILEGGDDGKVFPSRFIPVARVVGNEYEVDGKNYISGIVRNAKDSQRMYNIAQTAIVERVMQAPKSPWVAPAEAIEGYEKVWQTANTANHSFLPFNHKDEAGEPIPAPNRTAPATVETGLAQIAASASDDIKAETGQYDASLGQKSNETSGKAIMARQREGDNATYHYVDNLGRAVRHIGRIILDMIPAIYDTKRVARILGEDGEAANAILDPDHPEAFTEVRDENNEIKRIFNPNIGLYDVYTTTGPSYSTRRVEATEAMTAIAQGNPEMWQVAGDLMVKSMDWPGAEELAKRMRLMLPPQIQAEISKDEGGQPEQPQIPPEMQQRMMQVAEQMETMGNELQETKSDLQKAQQKAWQEEGKRIKAEIDADKANALLAIEKAQDSAAAANPAAGQGDVQEMVNQAVAMALANLMQQREPEPMPEPEPPMEMPQPEQPPMDGGMPMPESEVPQ